VAGEVSVRLAICCESGHASEKSDACSQDLPLTASHKVVANGHAKGVEILCRQMPLACSQTKMVGRRSRSSFSATALQTRIRTDAQNSGNSLQSPDLIKTVGLASSCRIFDAHVFAARRVLAQFEQFVTVYPCAGWS